MYLVYNTVVQLCQFFGCGGKLFYKWEQVSTKESYWGYFLWSASQCVFFIRPNTLLLCIFLFCLFLLYCTDPFSCTAQIHKLKFKSEYYLRIYIGNPEIPLWFLKKWLFGFRSIFLRQQSQTYDTFSKNIETFSNFSVAINSQKYRVYSMQIGNRE